MKLFLRDHLSLLIFALFQALLIPVLYWSADDTGWGTAVYAVLLEAAVLLAYLIWRYAWNKDFYNRLEEPIAVMDESFRASGDSPLGEALAGLLETQFRNYQSELHEARSKMEHQADFMMRWVHQMKTPLSVLQLTVQDMDEPEGDHMQEELDRLHKGLEMALYTSRLDRFQHDFHVETILLSQVVESVLAVNRRHFIRSEVFPVLQLDPELKVRSDEKWLQFVIGQIAENAVNYSRGKGRTVTFRSFSWAKGNGLEIKDEGIGIALEDQRRVFDPHFTGRQGRDYRESTGMGLYLVKQVCDRLGHRVELSSKQGKGTSVCLYFVVEQAITNAMNP
ncbi:hypothetical protein DCC85_07535 [Paenibacillus sp. CAA11]|uniref:sensor histidine kinase n=1 Tax=Paenibacillus sp. CAA11 TaxID=1532905 RepID=UPI000D3CA163|nr:sensor histidine kinase [Paenibacillus sp. CAA11]AWB44083.1 hypothetical protein DCC85_07535 [Paenibacillus sp. CAA11]